MTKEYQLGDVMDWPMFSYGQLHPNTGQSQFSEKKSEELVRKSASQKPGCRLTTRLNHSTFGKRNLPSVRSSPSNRSTEYEKYSSLRMLQVIDIEWHP